MALENEQETRIMLYRASNLFGGAQTGGIGVGVQNAPPLGPFVQGEAANTLNNGAGEGEPDNNPAPANGAGGEPDNDPAPVNGAGQVVADGAGGGGEPDNDPAPANGAEEEHADDPAPVNAAEQVAANGAGGDGAPDDASGKTQSSEDAQKKQAAAKKAKRNRRFAIADSVLGVAGSLFGALAESAKNSKNPAFQKFAKWGNITKGGLGMLRSGISMGKTIWDIRDTVYDSKENNTKISGRQKAGMIGSLISGLSGMVGGFGGIGAAAGGGSQFTEAARWSELLGSGGGLMKLLASK